MESSVIVEALSGSLSEFDFTGVTASPRAFVFDLSRITFAKPAPVIALIVKVESVLRVGGTVRVIAPTSMDVANYLCRSHLPAALSDLGVDHNFGSVHERAHGFAIVELARFNDADSVNSLAQGVHAFAQHHSVAAAGQLYDAVCEAGENVSFHSGAEYGYMMAQYFPRMGKFEFALGDNGMGFRGSLQSVGATDHSHALELAATPGISATREPTRGFGLSSIRENIVALDGSFTLASGDAYRVFTAASPMGYSGQILGSHDGSVVHGTIRG